MWRRVCFVGFAVGRNDGLAVRGLRRVGSPLSSRVITGGTETVSRGGRWWPTGDEPTADRGDASCSL
jgi:hypothetical protein